MLRDGESIDELYAKREGLYRQYADLTVPEKGLNLEETVKAVLEMIP